MCPDEQFHRLALQFARRGYGKVRFCNRRRMPACDRSARTIPAARRRGMPLGMAQPIAKLVVPIELKRR